MLAGLDGALYSPSTSGHHLTSRVLLSTAIHVMRGTLEVLSARLYFVIHEHLIPKTISAADAADTVLLKRSKPARGNSGSNREPANVAPGGTAKSTWCHHRQV